MTKQKKNELSEEPQAEEEKNGTYGSYGTHENADLPIHTTYTTHKTYSSPQKAIYAIIREALAQGEDVRLPGLGVLKVKTSPARMARNPRTGETIAVPARNHVRFSQAAELRQLVNEE